MAAMSVDITVFLNRHLSQMVDTKRHFGKLDKRQGYHFILSFEEDEVSEEEGLPSGRRVCDRISWEGF